MRTPKMIPHIGIPRLAPKQMSSSHLGGRGGLRGRDGRACCNGAPQFKHSTASSLFSTPHIRQNTNQPTDLNSYNPLLKKFLLTWRLTVGWDPFIGISLITRFKCVKSVILLAWKTIYLAFVGITTRGAQSRWVNQPIIQEIHFMLW